MLTRGFIGMLHFQRVGETGAMTRYISPTLNLQYVLQSHSPFLLLNEQEIQWEPLLKYM